MVDVSWKEDKNNNVVLDIKNHKEDTTHQHKKYKGRVSSFPQEYNSGNFSIVMKNLQENDNGTYECHISSEHYLQRVDLKVSGQFVYSRSDIFKAGSVFTLQIW